MNEQAVRILFVEIPIPDNSLVASGDFLGLLMTFANNFDPDEAPQNVGPHLLSKLIDTQIVYHQTIWMEKKRSFAIFENRKKRDEIYPACKWIDCQDIPPQ